MKNSFVLTLFCLGVITTNFAQTIRTIQDPMGNDIVMEKDSAFLTIEDGNLILYAIDKETGNRNILVTNGDTSYWLVPDGFSKSLFYSPIIHWRDKEFIFRVGNTWYRAKSTPATFQVFYENDDDNNPFEYLRLLPAESQNLSANDFLIEAREKLSGDTTMLYYNTEFGTTSPFGKKLRVIESGLQGVGPYRGSGIIASLYNEEDLEWGDVGYYRQFQYSLTLLLPLGQKNKYALNFLAGSKVVDHFEDGTKKVYQYYSSQDSCIEVTQELFQTYKVLEYQNLKWTSYGYPYEPPLSYYDYFWKGRIGAGSIKYFVPSSLGENLEIVDLRNAPNVDFIQEGGLIDSMYYYNYSDNQTGFVRCHIYNGGTKKDPTSIAFDSDFKLRGYLSVIYFGRYNPVSGKIEACRKDFANDGAYSFIESANGQRIEGPTDFTFLDDKIFVHSRTNEGLKLVVYDPDGLVAVENHPQISTNLKVTPNPSSGLFSVNLKGMDFNHHEISFFVTNAHGIPVLKGEVIAADFTIDLTNNPGGSYNLTLLSKESLLFTTRLILISK